MSAVEDVLVAAAARHRCDFAAVEADAHVTEEVGLRGRGRLPDGAAEVETCREMERMLLLILTEKALCFKRAAADFGGALLPLLK